ncbi:MAG: hypothetical protein JO108_28485 [Acidobacteriaceae bacterium]|nr:hypothetical protein [Acidobacteriaceae bacterium]
MEQSVSLLSDARFWISVLAAATSGWSAFNSWQSRRLAKRALSISEHQEQRRRPQLTIYIAGGYRRYLPDKQLFGFLVSVSNPSDINNSVAQAELQVTYLLDREIKAVWRVPHTPSLGENVAEANGRLANVFSLPARIEGHQTAAGWLVFSLDNNVIAGKTIDAHRIILEDSHGASTKTEPILVRDWTDETAES